MFSVSYTEGSASLTCVHLITCETFKLVNPVFLIFVYQLECLTYNKVYKGQTCRPFRVRYREHYNDFKYSNNKSTFAQHVVNEGHSFGPVNEIMNIVHYEKKGKMLDTFEKYYIYKEAKSDNQLNDRLAIQNNLIF